MTMQPKTDDLNQIVQRIVHSFHPLRIIIFGSAVRGKMVENSDVDLLVICRVEFSICVTSDLF
ncbi:MAG: nucleotidyltransferase domain-containing protein [Candidatus Omnitrophota bacterium]|nr:MAG: nucleotidyltransferase domain-containing protein [Candidatus Omnitrophota bacterium]